MSSFSDNMSDRFMVLIVNIIKLEKTLCKTYSGRHIYGQLFRAGSSAGANYEEAKAGESRADFIHKMQIVLKELRETHFWLKLAITAELSTKENEVLKVLLNDTKELSNITAKSIVTTKSKIAKDKP